MSDLHRLNVYVAGNPLCSRDEIRSFMDYVIDNSPWLYLETDWLDELENSPKREEMPLEAYYNARIMTAHEDLRAVAECNVMVLFDAPIQSWGIYVELGAALAAGKKVIVVNPSYLQVFYYHANVIVVENAGQAKDRLADLHAIETFAAGD